MALHQYLEKLKQGDQSAFLPFYQKTAPGLMRFLMWKTKGDKPFCEDILQDSFVRFLCHVDNVQATEDAGIQGYLLRIVRNCLIDKATRLSHVQHPHVPIEEIYSLADNQALSRTENSIEMRELWVAMRSPRDKDSEILWLKDVMGMSHKEVAEQFGMTEQASRQAYVRAKRSLIEELKVGFRPKPKEIPSHAP